MSKRLAVLVACSVFAVAFGAGLAWEQAAADDGCVCECLVWCPYVSPNGAYVAGTRTNNCTGPCQWDVLRCFQCYPSK